MLWGLRLWLFVGILSCLSESRPPEGNLEEEFKNIINLNKYSPAIREIVAKIFRLITIFDCYDMKVNSRKPFFSAGSAFSATAFDALKGLKKAQKDYTDTISDNLIHLRDMTTALHNMPDIVGGIQEENVPCYVGGIMYKKEDCNECKRTTPAFKTKYLAKIEMRVAILQLQENIPKQFLYYASDIIIITSEAIRIIDKVWDCLENVKNACDTREKAIGEETKKMEEVAKKEDHHRKFILAQKTKINVLIATLEKAVSASMNLVVTCLFVKHGKDIMGDVIKGGVDWGRVSLMAKLVGVDMETVKPTDSKRVVAYGNKKGSSSVGTKMAIAQKRRRSLGRR